MTSFQSNDGTYATGSKQRMWAGKTLSVMNTLARCCRSPVEAAPQPVRLDLGCMALAAGKDILVELLEALQGTKVTGGLSRLCVSAQC